MSQTTGPRYPLYEMLDETARHGPASPKLSRLPAVDNFATPQDVPAPAPFDASEPYRATDPFPPTDLYPALEPDPAAQSFPAGESSASSESFPSAFAAEDEFDAQDSQCCECQGDFHFVGEGIGEYAGDEGEDYGYGLEYSLWGWLSYIAMPQYDWYTFWAWEAEVDVTKSFSETIAASADIDFVDTNGGAWANIEQLFLSVLLPEWNDAIFTAGKFNAPFGVERRDFWERLTASTSLIFNAKPIDLTGLMFTQPWGETGVKFLPFVVNGFDDNLDINQEPSVGMMVQYQPCDPICLAVTNWWGPEFENDNGNRLFFVDAQLSWFIDRIVTFQAEFLHAATESPWGHLNWTGYAVITTYTFSKEWRLFAQISGLADSDGHITGLAQRQDQGSIGFSWFWHPAVELRSEYRRDHGRERWTGIGHNADSISAHLTFGY